ncbi:alanine racemase [Actinomycetes bacterium KLBMP 9759]
MEEVGITGGRGAPASSEAVIDLSAIAGNAAVARRLTSAAVMAVVKANAFGHGAVPVARAALAGGASWLGVASPAEALLLRNAGIEAPILAWLFHPSRDLRAAVCGDIQLSVSSAGHMGAVVAAARATGRTVAVHLKIDTGMARGGAAPEDWPDLVRTAYLHERAGLIDVRGVWSHLADSDDPVAALVPRQVARFEAAVALAERVGLRPSVRHLANSSAALHHPGTHFDMVRFGIGLYGVEPVPDHPTGLRGAMTLHAPIVQTRRVRAGTGVSYRHDYVTPTSTRLGLVPVGYADGLPRSASAHAQVWVGVERRPVAGRISMDQFVVDLGIRASEPDHVVVFGPGTGGEPTVAEWATWAGTIPHEVLTGIGARVRRRWIGAVPDLPPAACSEARHA